MQLDSKTDAKDMVSMYSQLAQQKIRRLEMEGEERIKELEQTARANEERATLALKGSEEKMRSLEEKCCGLEEKLRQ